MGLTICQADALEYILLIGGLNPFAEVIIGSTIIGFAHPYGEWTIQGISVQLTGQTKLSKSSLIAES